MAERERCSATGCRVARPSDWERSPHRRSPSRQTSLAWRPHAFPFVSGVRRHQRRAGAEVPRRRRGQPLRPRLASRLRTCARRPPGSVRERCAPRDRRVSRRTERALPRMAKLSSRAGGSAFASMARRAQSPAPERAMTKTAVRVARADTKDMANLFGSDKCVNLGLAARCFWQISLLLQTMTKHGLARATEMFGYKFLLASSLGID